MENKSIHDQKLDFNMDFQEIKFISSEFPREHGILMNPSKPYDLTNAPSIYYYVPDECSTNLPFYAIVAGHFLVGSEFYTKRENLFGYQCILTLDGSCTMEIEGQKPFECSKGSLLILDCMKKHYYHTGKGRTWQYKHFHFDTNFSPYLPEQALGLVQISGSDIETTIDNIFRAISQQRPQSPYIISDLISHILTEAVFLRMDNPVLNAHSHILEEAAYFLREHFNEDINVGEIASRHFLSKYYFIKLFTDYYGTSPYAYLTNYRVQKAKECLILNMTVAETANLCGFGNMNNLNRIFKRCTGMTPSEFRKTPF